MHGTCVSHVFAKLLDAIILELIRGRTPLRITSEALNLSHQSPDDQKASNCAIVFLVLRVT